MSEQLSFFEPTGDEVIALAQRCEINAERLYDLGNTLGLCGMTAKARELKRRAQDHVALANQYWMLAEFEALAGVSA